MAMRALFNGDGWGLEEGRRPEILLEGEERRVLAEKPELLPGILASLDEIASSGDPHLLAAGFISYEAGVWLEGSASLVRPHDFLSFAEFSVFDTRRSAVRRPAPPPPAESSLFTFKESATAERRIDLVLTTSRCDRPSPSSALASRASRTARSSSSC